MKNKKLLVAMVLALLPMAAGAGQTVCTITVNSPDEKEMMRERLPAGRYDFVELVERGRPDWLRNACQRQVKCDVLVVSGHFNAGDTFYSDRPGIHEHLAIDELERASCSESCPGLFSELKEVYLFGCESLNPDASKYASRYGESGRERMRRIFADVPSIYGFSGAAPVGPTAASQLSRYFDSGGAGVFGSGAINSRLLGVFSRSGMTRVSGSGQAQAAKRARVCGFYDDRATAGARLDFIHGLLREGDIGANVRRIEATLDGMSAEQKQDSAFAESLARLSADDATRERFLAFSRKVPDTTQRVRMLELAGDIGWLSPGEREEEVVALANDLLETRALGFAQVGLLCRLNADGKLNGAADRVEIPAWAAHRVAHSAALACLGDPVSHGRTLQAIVSTDSNDAKVVQAYLRHRPVKDASELRPVVMAVARMNDGTAQARALEALARLPVTDRESLAELSRSYAQARTALVQDAIAEVFLRSDYRSAGLADTLRQHRLTPARAGVVDSLLARLETR